MKKLSSRVISCSLSEIDFDSELKSVKISDVLIGNETFQINHIKVSQSSGYLKFAGIISSNPSIAAIINIDIDFKSETSIAKILKEISSGVFSEETHFDLYFKKNWKALTGFSIEKDESISKFSIDDAGISYNNDYYSFFFQKAIKDISPEKQQIIAKINASSYLSEIKPCLKSIDGKFILIGDITDVSVGINIKEINLPVSSSVEERGLIYYADAGLVKTRLFPSFMEFLQKTLIDDSGWKVDLKDIDSIISQTAYCFNNIVSQNEKMLF